MSIRCAAITCVQLTYKHVYARDSIYKQLDEDRKYHGILNRSEHDEQKTKKQHNKTVSITNVEIYLYSTLFGFFFFVQCSYQKRNIKNKNCSTTFLNKSTTLCRLKCISTYVIQKRKMMRNEADCVEVYRTNATETILAVYRAVFTFCATCKDLKTPQHTHTHTHKRIHRISP